VKKGEFPFSVTYEFNGEIKTVSGVYVCEYKGTSWALDGGHHRDWNGYIKDGKVEETIEIGATDNGGKVALYLDLYPDYFMDDYNMEVYDVPAPYIQIKSYSEDGGMSVIYDPNEVKELCGARIISYEYDAPVQNSFSIFNFK
jgi:hypothetical protein